MKKVFKSILYILLALIIALLLVPVLFKESIVNAIKSEINDNIEAELDFKNVDLSIIKAFPDLKLSIDSLSITGINRFKGKTLFSTKKAAVDVDLLSIIKSNSGAEINSLVMDEATINIWVDSSGFANYDISKPSETTQTNNSLFGNIQYYEIKDSEVNYNDESSDISLEIKNINHKGKGNFSDVQFDLQTESDISGIKFKQEGIPYLYNADLSGPLDLNIDLDKSIYTFKKNLIKLNDFEFEVIGDIQLVEEIINMKLDFKAINNKVSSIISLVPGIYSNAFEGVQSEGIANFVAQINGSYNSLKSEYPAISIKSNIDNGYLKFNNLNYPLENIDFDLSVKSARADWSDLKVDIETFKFLLDKKVNAVDGHIYNAMTDPLVEIKFLTDLDLKKLAEAIPMEGYDIESGLLKSQGVIKARQSDVENQKYDKIVFSGEMGLNQLDLTDIQSGESISIDELTMDFKPEVVNVGIENLQAFNSDFGGTAEILNPLSLVMSENTAQINPDISSNFLDLNYWLNEDSSSAADSSASIVYDPNFAEVDLTYHANKLGYGVYEINDLYVNGSYSNDKFLLKQSRVIAQGSAIDSRGEFTQIQSYVNGQGNLEGELYLESNKLDVGKFITEDDTKTTDAPEIVLIPKNLNLDIIPEINLVKYFNYKLKNTRGLIRIEEGKAMLENGSSYIYNGKVAFEGMYDPSEPSNPLFNFKYDLSNMQFQKFFEESESFKALAPIAEYIDGIFNSTLVISGPLKKDMMPDLYKINASGFLETVRGKIDGFAPLEKLSSTLGLEKIKDWDIKDSRNWFDIENGIVSIKPQDYEFEDMKFTVTGNHSIDQKINYTINAQVPRDKLSSAQLGKTLDSGIALIEKEASSRGVDIGVGDYIYLDITVSGSLKDPKIKVVPVGSGGKTLNEVVKDKLTEETDKLRDTIQTEIEKKTEEIKDSITEVVKAQKDSVTQVVNQEVDKQVDKIKDGLGEKIDSTLADKGLDSLSKKTEEKLKDLVDESTKEDIDSLKNVLNDWNPFKKKKKKKN